MGFLKKMVGKIDEISEAVTVESKPEIVYEVSQSNDACENQKHFDDNSNSKGYEPETAEMSRDLMIYIGQAIDKWAMQYGMDQLPKNLVFKKALTLMNAWDRTTVFK